MTEGELVELDQRARQREAENAPALSFVYGGRIVGQMYYDARAHDFKFEGELDASARIFADLVLRALKEKLDAARH